VCGLRVADVDFMRGIVSPVQQYPADPLKTEMSRTPIPIPSSLALTLSAHVAKFPSTWIRLRHANASTTWTSMGTCGRTLTTAHGPPSML
jgi:hypothetical protein